MLTAVGCPVCRYAAEASDRYLDWFALEAHAEAGTITRLCASLGMCARHTRGLVGQPGAATRLTAVYPYIVAAARDRMAGRATPLAACPACDHDGLAADRALDTLLEGLAEALVRDRCRELGGLCIQHLRAATARGQRRVVTWLADTMAETLSAHPAGVEWLAGVCTATRRRAPSCVRRSIARCGDLLAKIESETAAGHFTYGELGEKSADLAKLALRLENVRADDAFGASQAESASSALARCREALDRLAERVCRAGASPEGHDERF